MLEKIWIIFAHIIYIEWIIKDLIVFKKNPEFIKLINSWTTSIELNDTRKEWIRKTFKSEILDEFFSLYPIDEESKNQLIIFKELRNIYGHCRIWKNYNLINHVPYSSVFDERKRILWLEWDWWVIKFDNIDADFGRFMPVLLEIEDKFFPQVCENLGLEYKKIQ